MPTLPLARKKGREMNPSPFMDRLSTCWLWLSRHFATRPITVCMVAIASVALTATFTYLIVHQENTQDQLAKVQSAFCNGSNPDPRNCQRLFNALLENPTPEQARRLRQIIKE